jgi:hypothetical protein
MCITKFKWIVTKLRVFIIMAVVVSLFIWQHESIHMRIFEDSNCPYNATFNETNFAFQVSAWCGENSTDLTVTQLANIENEIAAYNIGTPLVLIFLMLYLILDQMQKGDKNGNRQS